MPPHTVSLTLDSELIERSRALAARLSVTLDTLTAQGLVSLLERYTPVPFPLVDEPDGPSRTPSGVKRWKRTDLRRRGLEIPAGS